MASEVQLPSSGATLSNAGTSENAEAWVSPGNVTANDGTQTTITAATYDSPDISQLLVASNFGFAIPTGSTIDGIIVEIDRSNAAGAASDNRVQLATGTAFANLVGDNKAATTTDWPTAQAVASYGANNDDWNAGLTVAQINAAGFAVMVSVQADAANTDVGVDYIQVTVFYTAPTPQFISPSSIDTDEAVGTPSLVLSVISIVPTAVDTAEALGTPTLLAGSVRIIVTGIASDEAIGSHTLSLTIPSANILPTAINTAEAVGTPTLRPGGVLILPSSVTTGEAVGTPSLIRANINISPPAIASGEVVGLPSLSLSTIFIVPTAITTGEAVGTPSLVLSLIRILPTGIVSSEVFGTATLRPGNVFIIVSSVGTQEAVGFPTLVAPILGSTINPSSISSQELFGLPILRPGSVVIVAESAASAEALGLPVLVPGSTQILVNSISSGQQVGTPRIVAVVVITGGSWGKVSRSPTWSTTKKRGWHDALDSLVKTRKNEGNR